MRYFSIIIVLILCRLIYGQNNSANSTVPSARFLQGVLTRGPIDWAHQGLSTATNAFSLGIETGRQWFNFGLNTANQWINAISNPPNSTTSNNNSIAEQAIQQEIAKLQKDLGNKGTWFRGVKERRLQFLIDKLNLLHNNSENNLDNSVTPLDVTNYTFTVTQTPGADPGSFSSPPTDDSIISVIN